MVRETRHLWVGNLPDNITEDRIKEHFKRYGRVQSVKLLSGDGAGGPAATVAFIDIKSAAKAHNADNRVEDRPLITSYHDPNGRPPGEEATGRAHPGAVGPGPGPGPYPAGRGRGAAFSRGCADDMSVRSSQLYGDAFGVRRYDDYKPGRRNFRNGPFLDRAQGSRYRPGWYGGDLGRFPPADVYPGDRSPGHVGVGVGVGVGKPLGRRGSPAALQHARITISNNKAAQPKRSGSGSGSESRSHSRSSSRSRSSASSRSTSSSSRSSRSRSGSRSKSRSPSRRNKRGGLSSAVAAVAASNQQSGSVSSGIGSSSPQPNGSDEHRRPIAICVKNLPARSSDTSLKDGLFHEYKKHGKVTTVKIIGQGAERYAIVCFKKPEDAEKALNVSHDKSFFGSKIEVALYDGFEVDDCDHRLFSRQYDSELDEYHPKATRTLFIGNLDKDVKQAELRKAFEKFGEIIEVDIKKQQSSASYAFLQFCDIESVVKAMRAMDGEHLGGSAAKLGFGRSMSNSVVWVDGVADAITDKYLARQFSKFGNVVSCDINRARGSALVAFDTPSPAQVAVIEMRGRALGGKRLQIDFASRECQEAFYDQLAKEQPKWDREHAYRFGQQRYERGARTYRGGRFVRRGGRTFEYDEFAREPSSAYDDSYEQELRDYYSQRHGDPEYRRVLEAGSGSYSPARRRSSADRSPSATRTESRRSQLQSVVTVGRRGGDDESTTRAHATSGSGDESGERPAKRPRTAEPLSDAADPRTQIKRTVTAEPDVTGAGGKPIEVHVTSRRGSDVKRSDSRRVSVDSAKTDADGEVVTREIPLEPVSKRRRRSEGGDPRTARLPAVGSSATPPDDDGQGTPLYDEVDERPAAAVRLQPMVLPLPKFAQHFMTTAQAQALAATSPAQTPVAPTAGASSAAASSSSAATSRAASAVSLTSPPSLLSPPRRPSTERRPELSTKASCGSAADAQLSPRGSDSSDHSPLLSPSLEDQIRALDVKYEKWSGSSRTIGCTVPSDRLKLSSRLLSLDRIRSQPSSIMQTLLAKQSVFDEDSKRLENFGQKYEPKPMDPAVASELRTKTVVSGTSAISGTFSGLISKVCRSAPVIPVSTPPSATLTSAYAPVSLPSAATARTSLPSASFAPMSAAASRVTLSAPVNPAPVAVPSASPAPVSIPSTSHAQVSQPSTPLAPPSVPCTSPAPVSVPTASHSVTSVPSASQAPIPSASPAPVSVPSASPAPVSLPSASHAPSSVPSASPAPVSAVRPPAESRPPAPTAPAEPAAQKRPQPQPPPPLTMPVDVSPAGAARTAPVARLPAPRTPAASVHYSPVTPVSATIPAFTPTTVTETTASPTQTSGAVTPLRRPEPSRLVARPPPAAPVVTVPAAEPGSPCWEQELSAPVTDEAAAGGLLEPEVPASLPTPPCSVTDRASVDSVSDCTVSSSTEIGADQDKKLAECASPQPAAEEGPRPEEPPPPDADHAGTLAEPLISSSSSLSKETAPAPIKLVPEDALEKEPVLKERVFSDEELLKSVMKPTGPLDGLHGVTERVMTVQTDHALDELVAGKLSAGRVNEPAAGTPAAPARTAKVKREHSVGERPRSDSVSSRGDKREKSSSHRNSEHHRRADKSSERSSKEQRNKDRRPVKETSKETPAQAAASREPASTASSTSASKRRLSSLEESDCSVDSKHSKHRHERRDDSSSIPTKKPKLASVSSTISSSSIENDAPTKPEKPPREKSASSSVASHRQHDDEKADREQKRAHESVKREEKHDKKRDESKYKSIKKENHVASSEEKREEVTGKGNDRVDTQSLKSDQKKSNETSDRGKHRSSDKERTKGKSGSHDKKREKHAASKERIEREREGALERASKEAKRADKSASSVRKSSKLVYSSDADSDVEEKPLVRKPKEKEAEKSHPSSAPGKDKGRSKDQDKRREKKAGESFSRSSDHPEKAREALKLEIKVEPGLDLQDERPGRSELEKTQTGSHDKKSSHTSNQSHASHPLHPSHQPQVPPSKDKLRSKKKSVSHFGSNSDSDSDDEPPKKNIFDVVLDDEPPFFSMYDKVKRQRACQIKKAEEPKTPVYDTTTSKKSSRIKSSSRIKEKKSAGVITSGSDDSDADVDPVFSKKKHFETSSEDEAIPRKPLLVKEEVLSRHDDANALSKSSKKIRESDKPKSAKPKAKPKPVLSELSDDDEVKKSLVPATSSSKKNRKLRMSDIYSDESDSSGPPVLEPSVPVATELSRDDAKLHRRRDRDKARPKPREHAATEPISAEDAAARAPRREPPQPERRRARSGHSDERKRDKPRQDGQRKDDRIEAIFGPMSDSDTALSPVAEAAASEKPERLPVVSQSATGSGQPPAHVSPTSTPPVTSSSPTVASSQSLTTNVYKGKLQVSDIYDSDSDGGQSNVGRPRTPALQPTKARASDEWKDWKEAKEPPSRTATLIPKKEITEEIVERVSVPSVSVPRSQASAQPKNIESSLKSIFGDYEEMSCDGPPSSAVSSSRGSVADETRAPPSATRTPALSVADDVFRFSDESSDLTNRPRKEKKKKKKKDKDRKEGERRRSSVDLGKELYVDVRGSDHERASPRILSPIGRAGCSPRLTSPHEMISPKTRKSPKPCLSPKPTYVSPRAAAQAAANEERRNSLDPFDQLLESRCFKSPGRHTLDRLPRSPAALPHDGEVSLPVPAPPAVPPASLAEPTPPAPPASLAPRLSDAMSSPHHHPSDKCPASKLPSPLAAVGTAAVAGVPEKPPTPAAVSPVVRTDHPEELSLPCAGDQPSPPLRAHHSPSLPSTAVLSILTSAADTTPPKPASEQQTSPVIGKDEKKSRAVISQEETEDAVATLLGQTFNFGYEPAALEPETPESEPEPLAMAADPDEAAQAVQSLAGCIGSPDKLVASPAVLDTPGTPASTVEEKLDAAGESETAPAEQAPAAPQVAESPCRSEPELQIDEDDKPAPEADPAPEAETAAETAAESKPEPQVPRLPEPAKSSPSDQAAESARSSSPAPKPEPPSQPKVEPKVEPLIVSQVKLEPKLEPLRDEPPPAAEAKPASPQNMAPPSAKCVPPVVVKQDPTILGVTTDAKTREMVPLLQPKMEPTTEPITPISRPRSYSKTYLRAASKPEPVLETASTAAPVPSPVIVRSPAATTPATAAAPSCSPITPATVKPAATAETATSESATPVTGTPVSAAAPAPALSSAAPATTQTPTSVQMPSPTEKTPPEVPDTKPTRTSRARAPRPSRSKAALAAAEAAKAAAAEDPAAVAPSPTSRPATKRPARAARGKAAAAAAAAAAAEKEEAKEAAEACSLPPPPPPAVETRKPRSRAPAGGRSRKKPALKGSDVYEFHDSGDDDASKRAEAAAEERKRCTIDDTIEDVVQGRFGDWESAAANAEEKTNTASPPAVSSAPTAAAESVQTAPVVSSPTAALVPAVSAAPVRLPPPPITTAQPVVSSAVSSTAASSTGAATTTPAATLATPTTTAAPVPAAAPTVPEGEAMLDPVTGLMVPLKAEEGGDEATPSTSPEQAAKQTASPSVTAAASAASAASAPVPKTVVTTAVPVPRPTMSGPVRPEVYPAGGQRPPRPGLPPATYAHSRPHLPTTSGVRPQLPSSPNVRPQLPTSPGLRTQLPTSPGVRPQLPVSSAVRPQLPASSAVRPQMTASSAVRPQLPASSAVRPQLSASSAVRPQLPASSTVRPQLPTSPGVRTQLPTSPGVRPQLTTSPGMRPQLPTSPGVRPQLPTSPGVRPQLATSSAVRPPLQTSAGVPRPGVPTLAGTRPQLPTTGGARPTLPTSAAQPTLSVAQYAPRGLRPAAPATYLSKPMSSTAGVPCKPATQYQPHPAVSTPQGVYLTGKFGAPAPAAGVFPGKTGVSQSGPGSSTGPAASLYPAKAPARANSPAVLPGKPASQPAAAATVGTAAAPVSASTTAPTVSLSPAAPVAAFPAKGSAVSATGSTYPACKAVPTAAAAAAATYPAKSVAPGAPVLYAAKQVTVSSPATAATAAAAAGGTINLSTTAMVAGNKTAASANTRAPPPPVTAAYLGKPAAVAVTRPSVVESPRPRPLAGVPLTTESRRLSQPPVAAAAAAATAAAASATATAAAAAEMVINYKVGSATPTPSPAPAPAHQQAPVSLTTRDPAAAGLPEPLPEPPRVEVSGRASVGAISTPSPASQGRHSVQSPAPRQFESALHGAVRHGVIQELHGYGDDAGRGSPHTPPPAHQRVMSQSDMLRRSGGIGMPPPLGSGPASDIPPHYVNPFYHPYLVYHEMAMRSAAGLAPHPGYAPPLASMAEQGAPQQKPQHKEEPAEQREPCAGPSEGYAASARGWHPAYHETAVARPEPPPPPAASPMQLESPCSRDIAELQRYRPVWAGQLELKSDRALVQFRLVSGSRQVADASLPRAEPMVLHIHKRMRLDFASLDGVARKMKNDDEYCMLLAVPAIPVGGNPAEELAQHSTLRTAFITYLQLKQAAGIINIDGAQGSYVVHIFPPCDFANENMANIAPDLLSAVSDVPHLVIVIATC